MNLGLIANQNKVFSLQSSQKTSSISISCINISCLGVQGHMTREIPPSIISLQPLVHCDAWQPWAAIFLLSSTGDSSSSKYNFARYKYSVEGSVSEHSVLQGLKSIPVAVNDRQAS